MIDRTEFDVIIIGGSYAGLSAALALGRSLRHVLIIDSGKPCNRQTPHSHNFLTQDGRKPAEIAREGLEQVLRYPTVQFRNDTALSADGSEPEFTVRTESDETFTAGKLLFAAGVVDMLPDIEGIAECWGISVLHCPYCHGYEVRNEPTGILADGDAGFEFVQLIGHWTDNLTLLTNGPSTLTDEQRHKLAEKKVAIVENKIEKVEHERGAMTRLHFQDGNALPLTAIYARAAFRQHCPIPEAMGCGLMEEGYLEVNEWQQTTLPGVYAAGDATTPSRTVSTAVAAGTRAGIGINKALMSEENEVVG